ncbi:Carbohydrate-binding-like fold [Heracleum sosnowskyi]|uniref:Carbohydrate-binding-like fold n=1 Tax=Heracleum sosnowskyi TaxID=360622 RepID=A0AAD8J626_9APIA|nr:Carbohydrate-binding-like fold [Heracleum sosnowskyi]
MEALRGSAPLSPAVKLVSEKNSVDEGLFNRRNKAHFLRPSSLYHNHVNNLSFSVSTPLYKKRPIFPLSSLSSSDTQVQLDIQDEETEASDMTSQSKTVRVRFQLQRECSFGQQFHIVGDDPVLGQWDPSGAVPFNWSDGHVWTTTELDVPIQKCIKFKIIIKEGPENIIWQPGPDRILQTWETENTLTICEDWDSADCQKISDDEITFNQIAESIINEEDITDPNKEVHIDKSNTIQGTGSVSNVKESSVAVSDDDIDMLMLGGDGSLMNVEDSKVTTDETLSTNGLPLLVPGLDPRPTTQPEDKVLNEVEKNIFTDASIEDDKFKELNMPELKLEQVLDNDYREQHQHFQVENPQFAEDEGQPNPKSYDLVLEANNRWSTLQKLFANFLLE